MGWSISVDPVGAGRYAVLLLDKQILALKKPDGGEEHQGYTADELRSVLQTRYGLSDAEIDKRIAVADHQQSINTWRKAHSVMVYGRPTDITSTEALAVWDDLCIAAAKARAAMEEAAAKLQDKAG